MRLESDLKVVVQYLLARRQAAIGLWSAASRVAGSNLLIAAFLLELIHALHPCRI